MDKPSARYPTHCDGVQVGMTHAAKENLEFDVVCANLARGMLAAASGDLALSAAKAFAVLMEIILS